MWHLRTVTKEIKFVLWFRLRKGSDVRPVMLSVGIPLPKNLYQPVLQIITIAVSLSASGKLGQQGKYLIGAFVSSVSKRSAEVDASFSMFPQKKG